MNGKAFMGKAIRNSKTVIGGSARSITKGMGYGTVGGAVMGGIGGLNDDQSFFGGVASGAIHGAMLGGAAGLGRGAYRLNKASKRRAFKNSGDRVAGFRAKAWDKKWGPY